ncbi:WRKY transcription factor 23 [Ricinus communis]|uniref:WRKY transcription factor n=1 Tax=Ricinus communis TaxID=3988 RepID=B9RNB2_RICCO|nr:WRKY transcription factor 23 [Ricinus communis]EEF47235.1 WRKY transcription factor, putative [Ricinus communis]|eukprot:XP_002515251.1 probable WRKY transcription factor 23 [Ricinus communis]
MEGTEAVKIENIVGSSPPPPTTAFPDLLYGSYPLQSVFDNFYGGDKSSLGFLELLGVQDFTSPSVFDTLQLPSTTMQQPPATNNSPAVVVTKMESPEVFNQPATPNSSSISSASSEALNDEAPIKAVDNEEEEQQKTKKELKPKKTNHKRQREPRFAFMTKSEVDHLEDGYRWRKYGQKAVKNSPFPRSYYRCTTASCNVKKRVERSFSDPSIVVTTYEGQHTHPSPVMPRPSFVGAASESGFSATNFAMPMQRRLSLYQQPQQPFFNSFSPLGFGYNSTTNASLLHEKRFCTAPGAALLEDHGLLQDIVPSHMLKE